MFDSDPNRFQFWLKHKFGADRSKMKRAVSRGLKNQAQQRQPMNRQGMNGILFNFRIIVSIRYIGVCTAVEQPINQVVLDEPSSRENDDDGDAFGDDDNDTLLQIER